MSDSALLVFDVQNDLVDPEETIGLVEACCASPNPVWHDFAISQIPPVFARIVSSNELH